MAPRHPITPYSVGTGYMGAKPPVKPTRGTHHAAPTGTPPQARPTARTARTAATGRVSDEGKSFVDRAKVDQAKTKAKAKAGGTKSSSSAPKARPAAAAAAASAAKGGLMGLLAGNKGNNERLAKERMLKASRKG